jgi:hypothetical protein
MFKIIAAALLLSSAGVALASDASFDQRQVRTEKAAPKDAGAKAVAPAGCSCPHARS